MASIKNTKTSNKVLFDTIRNLKKYSSEVKDDKYRKVAFELSRVASQRANVNISKLNKICKDKETVIVCGKVLGDGVITKSVNVISFKASLSAISKIKNAKGSYSDLNEYILKKPKDKFRIIK